MKITSTYTVISVFTISIILYSCFESDVDKGEWLAKTYCGSCHLFPEPSLLDKKTWIDGIMPEMAFRMGVDNSKMYELSSSDLDAVVRSFPGNPMLSPKEFDLIKEYYKSKAPDTLIVDLEQPNDLTLFKANIWQNENLKPNISMVRNDTLSKSFWISDRDDNLFQYDYNFKLKKSWWLSSPLSAMHFKNDGNHFALSMGNMDPSDVYKGAILKLKPENKKEVLIDSLNRPSWFEEVDLNKDGLEDIVVCEFGNYEGGISLFANTGSGYKKTWLSKLPGSRKVVVQDFDNNGLPDILALITQGDEQLQLFLNSGNLKFRIITLKRFPPVYGSSYFELVDMDKDGDLDIVYSNGDNADYSTILKPYHGIRIYKNKGNFEFDDGKFFPMPGTSQTISKDFDHDGDIDIAAISFFPNFTNPEQGFVYFENQGTKDLTFTLHTTYATGSGRWLTMESIDFDLDGDQDLLLSAMNFGDAVPADLSARWKKEKAAIMILTNQTISKP